MSGGMPITQANASKASGYGAYRAACFDLIEGYDGARKDQASVEVGDAAARLERDGDTFLQGCRELQALLQFVARNTYIDGSLIGVHNETRALLLEGSVGYAVVFGKRTGRDLGPLGDLLLATHQLDWRLGERALAFSRLGDDLVDFYLGRDGYRPLGQRPVFAADCHLLPQYLYVGDARGGAVDRVLWTDRLDADALALLGELVPGVEAGCADPPCVREPVAARHLKKFAAEDLSNATVARVRDYYALDYALLNALRVSRGLAPYDDGSAHDYGAWAGRNATVAAVFAAFRRTALALPANATADDVRATMAPPDRRARPR